MNKFTTKKLIRAAVVAAMYTALTLVVLPISSGAVQLRASEALTILPLIFPETVISLFVGCLLSNIISGCIITDIVFGSLITLVAAILTCITGKFLKKTIVKITVGGLFPVFLNAFLLPVIWFFAYGQLEYLYIIQVLLLVAGQALAVYALGVPLYLSVNKLKKDNFKGFCD